MVLNVERLTQKTDLAKSLVEKGLAANLEDAMVMIDKQQLMRTDGDENITSVKTDSDTQKTDIGADEISQLKNHIERMKTKLDAVDGFVRKYAQNNDANLKELCIELERLHNRVKSIQSASGGAAAAGTEEKQETLEDKPKPIMEGISNCDKPPSRDDIDPDTYDINKIFSNSNNRMTK